MPAHACSRTATELNLSCRQSKLFQPVSISFKNKATFSTFRHSLYAHVLFQVLLVNEFPYVKGCVRNYWSCGQGRQCSNYGNFSIFLLMFSYLW